LERLRWSKLNPLQVGRYAEYFVKMEFTMHGFQVYTTEVDDRGIDFVVRKDGGRFYEVQVKSVRDLSYTYCTKDKMPLIPERIVALVLFEDGADPSLFLIPSLAWKKPDALLVDREYEGKRSKPEWGINLSRKNLPLLNSYRFSDIIVGLDGQPLAAQQAYPADG
jgi:hypothetical protein